MQKGNKYGLHRVIEPPGTLPQPAWKVDNTPVIYDNEILIDVNVLNITASAFTRIEKEAGKDEEKIKQIILDIISERGKFNDPVTGSGGILIGEVAQIGSALQGKIDLAVGEAIATLVSLSVTPLYVEEITGIDVSKDQVYVKGKAILFESGIYAKLPHDLPEALSVAMLDVAGAPAWMAKIAKAGDIVVVIGTGKAGMLCLHEAKKRAGITGKVIAIDYLKEQCDLVASLGLADIVIQGNATKPLEILEKVSSVTNGRMADVTFNTVDVENTEMATILSTKEHGTIYFFSMSISFTKAALGAESIGKVVNMLVGTGYTEGHADITLQILRENPSLYNYFTKLYQ